MNRITTYAPHPATSDLMLLAIFGAVGSAIAGVAGTGFWIIAIYIVWAAGLAWIWLFLTVMTAVGLVALGLLAHDPKVRKVARWLAPVLGDYDRGVRRASRRRGNAWLRDCDLLPTRPNEVMIPGVSAPPQRVNYPCWLRYPSSCRDGYLELRDLPLKGITADGLDRLCSESLGLLHAADFEVTRPNPRKYPNRWLVRLYASDRLSALASPTVLDRLPDVFIETGHVAVTVGRTLNGVRKVDLSGISGMTIAGQPGAGKTACADLLVAGLALRPDLVSLYVADGKGGGDWSWCSPYVTRYTNDDGFDDVLAMLHEVHDLMRVRLSSNVAEHGDSNFWHWGPTFNDCAVVVILDEIQTWIAPAMKTKETKEKSEEFIALVIDIVKKGRSAGITLIAMTQKPTTDALPSALRDNAALRVAFRCSTPEMAKAALGSLPDGSPSPTSIDFTQKGMSVMTADSGMAEYVQWDYLPESDIPVLLDAVR